ncbi:MAG: hypothetical protein ACOVT5_15775 [Armatimonadaceae bacterium]
MNFVEKSFLHRFVSVGIVGALVAGVSVQSAWAQKSKPSAKPAAKAPAAPKLPLTTADAVLDASAKAMGGDAATKIETSVVTGKMSIPAQGLTGTMVLKSKSPDKFVMVQGLPNIGEIRVGYDGKVGWSKDPFNGLRELKGEELAQTKDDVDRNSPSEWRKKVKSAVLLAPRKVAGSWCYVVKVTTKANVVNTQYIDAKTLLLSRVDVTMTGPTGKVPAESYLSDYRSVDGVKMPYKTRSIVAGVQEIVITYDKVENNVPVDDAEFTKPVVKTAPTGK